MSEVSSTTLLALATADATMKDGEKAVKAVEKAVRVNKNAWRSELFALTEAAEAAADNLTGLSRDTSATAANVLDAQRQVKLAEANLEAASTAYSARFGESYSA